MAESRDVFGAYTVLEQLGVGGMASVHVAETRNGKALRRVALKRLLAHAADNPTLVDLFLDEARLVRYLHHPNIAETYEVGKVGSIYFIAMELVRGPTLAQLLRQCSSTIGVIPFPITLNLLCQLCDALDYAHNCRDEHGKTLGIIHRDVSPPNVILSNTGLVKLIDFGVAKAKNAHVKTQVGTVKGKFSYMAPEYLDGKLDNRVDLWAIGALAHELLTSKQLFDAADDFSVLMNVKSMPIQPPSATNPDVPPDLDAIVMTALERDPDRRWQSAAAMRNALANAAAELQTIVTNDQLVQWVEWAFSQKPPGERSELSQLIRILEQPSRPSGQVKTPTPKFDLGTRPAVPRRVTVPPPLSPDRPLVPLASMRPVTTSPVPASPAAASSAAPSAPTVRLETELVRADRVPPARARGRIVLLLVLLVALGAAGAYAAWWSGLLDQTI